MTDFLLGSKELLDGEAAAMKSANDCFWQRSNKPGRCVLKMDNLTPLQVPIGDGIPSGTCSCEWKGNEGRMPR